VNLPDASFAPGTTWPYTSDILTSLGRPSLTQTCQHAHALLLGGSYSSGLVPRWCLAPARHAWLIKVCLCMALSGKAFLPPPPPTHEKTCMCPFHPRNLFPMSNSVSHTPTVHLLPLPYCGNPSACEAVLLGILPPTLAA
jgi:hypothetical protein